MPSLNIALNILQNPKIKRLRRSLGKEALVYLIALWLFAANFFPDDGFFADQTVDDLEEEAGWRGKNGVMVGAMVDIGLLDRVGEFFAVHDWSEHESHFLRYRTQAKNAAKARWSKDKDSKTNGTGGDAASMQQALPDAMPESCLANAPAAAGQGSALQGSAAAAHAASEDAAAVPSDKNPNTEGVRAALLAAGVTGKNLDELSAIPDLTATIVQRAFTSLKKSASRPAGLLISVLRTAEGRSRFSSNGCNHSLVDIDSQMEQFRELQKAEKKKPVAIRWRGEHA